MVGIARSNPFEMLIRKIGFSVGLGRTYERVIDLTAVYVQFGDVSYGKWSELVKSWGLENEHIGDVFRSLDLIEIRQRRTFVLPGLDIFAICKRYLESDERFRVASKLALTNLILLADADIFLNCLAAGYQKELTREFLTDMVRFKRQKLFAVYKMPEMRRRIAHIVNIEAQPTNAGGANMGATLSEQRPGLKPRNMKLLRNSEDTDVHVSEDYLRKVPVTRREWARSVGLFDLPDGMTERGTTLLKQYEAAGFRCPSGAFAVWPLADEFASIRLKPEDVDTHPVSYWDFYSFAARAFGVSFRQEDSDDDDLQAVKVLRDLFRLYQTVNPKRAMLRNEFPINIAYGAYLAIASAESGQANELPAIIDRERRKEAAAVDYRTSRLHEGSLVFRS